MVAAPGQRVRQDVRGEVRGLGGGAGGDGDRPGRPAERRRPAVEEKTEFTLLLKSVAADKKIKVIKEVRVIKPDLGLKEAKDLVDGAPKELLIDV